MEPKHTWNLGYWVLVLLLLFLMQDIWQNTRGMQTVSYSEFEKALSEGRISEVLVSDRSVVGRLKTPDGNKTSLVAVRVEPDLAARLAKFDVPYSRVMQSTLLRDLMSWIVPVLIFFGVWFFCFATLPTSRAWAASCPLARAAPRFTCKPTLA